MLFLIIYAIIFSMEITKQRITEQAKALGFDDIRYAAAGGSIRTTSGNAINLSSLLPGASCIIVLFASYAPALEPSHGNMGLSPYYVASNRAYNGAKLLAAFIEGGDGKALLTASISAREAALRTGGFIGDNGFYYHEAYGSYVCIHTILTDTVQPEEYIRDRRECLHCGACRSGCRGVGELSGCVRQHMHGVVPEALRGKVYQLLGCEKCQDVCPLNTAKRTPPYEFSLESLLESKCAAELKRLAGSNMARARRVISQAALYAVNSGAYDLADKLKQLSETAEEPARTHLRWAYDKLTGEHDDNA